MDKVLEKINNLKDELNSLFIEKTEIEIDIDEKNKEKINAYRETETLCDDLRNLNLKKNNLQYKLSNMNKWKKFTILKTILFALYFILGTILLNLALGWSTPMTIVCLTLATPPTIVFGQSGSYYYNKKYLKKHKLEDVEKEIIEKQKSISLNNKKIAILASELSKLNIQKNGIVNKIDLTVEEINELKELRSAVINEYIKNNQEFDSLINKEYDLKKEKKLNKKV